MLDYPIGSVFTLENGTNLRVVNSLCNNCFFWVKDGNYGGYCSDNKNKYVCSGIKRVDGVYVSFEEVK